MLRWPSLALNFHEKASKAKAKPIGKVFNGMFATFSSSCCRADIFLLLFLAFLCLGTYFSSKKRLPEDRSGNIDIREYIDKQVYLFLSTVFFCPRAPREIEKKFLFLKSSREFQLEP